MTRLRTAERAALALILALTALAGAANYGRWAPVPRFLLATLALAGLAWVVSFSTEQLGERFGPGITGMLQSTLGNLPELFVVVFALQKHELVVAQTAIIGSVFANALLVLGLVIVVGASRAPDGVMRFSHRLPRDTATLLVVTVFIIVVLGLSLGAHDRASHHYRTISAVGAACLLVVYLAWVVPYLRADIAPGQGSGAGGLEGEERAGGSARDRGAARARVRAPARARALEGEERADSHAREERAEANAPDRGALEGEERAGGSARDRGAAHARVRASALEGEERAEPHEGEERAEANAPDRGAARAPARARLSLPLNLALLLFAGAASAFVSDWFVNALAPAIKILSISQAFAGLVIVAIAGNAVENVAGIVLAYHRRFDLAISVVKNSVAQIAAFLFPLLVLISFALATTLTFSLAPVYIGALVLTALALAQVTGDGEAAAFEGWALIALYVILATLTQYE